MKLYSIYLLIRSIEWIFNIRFGYIYIWKDGVTFQHPLYSITDHKEQS